MLGETQVQKVYLGTNLVWEHTESSGTSRLPNGYTELDYIASTKTGYQYIDLNILLYDTLNKNYDIAMKFNAIGAGGDNTTQGTIFGCQDNTGSPWPGTFIRMSNKNMVGRYIGGTGKDNTLGQLGNDIELTEKTPPAKNVTNYNNSNKTHTWGTSLFCIFNTLDKSQRARFIEAKLYYFKLFVEGTLVRDMIPCINPSNVVGLYDLVGGVFYSSPNGYAFEAGNVVAQTSQSSGSSGNNTNINSNIVPVEYVQSANGGRVDTNLILSSAATIEYQNQVVAYDDYSQYNYCEVYHLLNDVDNDTDFSIKTGHNSGETTFSYVVWYDDSGHYNYMNATGDTSGLTTVHTIKFRQQGMIIDGVTTDVPSYVLTQYPWRGTHTYTLKTGDDGIKWYYLKIDDGNTHLDLRPCTYNGVAGFYDYTTNDLYMPTGGNWIAGSALT